MGAAGWRGRVPRQVGAGAAAEAEAGVRGEAAASGPGGVGFHALTAVAAWKRGAVVACAQHHG